MPEQLQQPQVPNPDQDPMAAANAAYAANLNLLGEKMREAGEGVSDSRMLDAYMAADDYAEGHDRLADNPHIQDLTGADKKLFALAAEDKQAHADRIAGDGAFDKRLDKIATGVRKNIDDEIEERMNDTLAFWGGEETPVNGGAGNGNGNGGNGGEGGGNGAGGEGGGEPQPLPVTPEFVAAQHVLIAARDKLARIRAEREASTTHLQGRKKRGKKAMEAALKEYEAAKLEAGLRGIEVLRNGVEGYDEADLNKWVNLAVFNESVELTARQAHIESENGQRKGLRGRFYNYWARHSQANLFSKDGWKQGLKDMAHKSGSSAILFIPLGLVTGAVIAPAVAAAAPAAVAGVFAATRVSRGLMGAKINKDAEAPRVATEKMNERLLRVHKVIGEASMAGTVIDQETISNMYRTDTKKAVNKNRKRAAIAGTTAAVMGAVTSQILEHVGWDHFLHHGNTSSNGGSNVAEAQPGSGGNNTPTPPTRGDIPSSGGNGNTQPTGGNGNTPPAGGNVRPTGPNGEYLTDEQIRIFRSTEFHDMVTQGEKIHVQVNAEYPIPTKSWIFNDRLIDMFKAHNNSLADRRVIEMLDYLAAQDRAANLTGAASGTAPSTL